MTTQVTIRACCADDIEVQVSITSASGQDEQFALQHGETGDYYVYEDREIRVLEVKKS